MGKKLDIHGINYVVFGVMCSTQVGAHLDVGSRRRARILCSWWMAETKP
jgi:hypothetical protein